MSWALAADLVMLLHFLFIIIVVLGAFAVWRWPVLALVHVPALAWGLYITAVQGVCPLTPIEQEFRIRAGQEGFEGGFIAHYVEPLVYPGGLEWEVKMFFALILLLLTLSLYWQAWKRHQSNCKGLRPE